MSAKDFENVNFRSIQRIQCCQLSNGVHSVSVITRELSRFLDSLNGFVNASVNMSFSVLELIKNDGYFGFGVFATFL